jgi:hypothetical protein
VEFDSKPHRTVPLPVVACAVVVVPAAAAEFAVWALPDAVACGVAHPENSMGKTSTAKARTNKTFLITLPPFQYFSFIYLLLILPLICLINIPYFAYFFNNKCICLRHKIPYFIVKNVAFNFIY